MDKCWHDLLLSTHRVPVSPVFRESYNADAFCEGASLEDPDYVYTVEPNRTKLSVACINNQIYVNYTEWVVCRVHPWNI